MRSDDMNMISHDQRAQLPAGLNNFAEIWACERRHLDKFDDRKCPKSPLAPANFGTATPLLPTFSS